MANLTQEEIDELIDYMDRKKLLDGGIEVAQFVNCECGAEKVGSPGHSKWCPKNAK